MDALSHRRRIFFWDFGLRFAHVASDIGHLLAYDFHILSDALEVDFWFVFFAHVDPLVRRCN